jgi:L-ascorbate metabolism protein UlaG (beta-lactamase superfamily)
MEINYLGHSCVELVDGDTRVLIDPFLKPNNPAAELTAEDVNPTHVALTHGHIDHTADAVAVGKRTGAAFVAHSEVANILQEQGIKEVSDPNFGGTVEFDWGWVRMVPAIHSSTWAGSEEMPFSPTPGTVTGPAGGVVVNLGGKTFYHLGDTALFSDLQLVSRKSPVDVAFIPIGGHYTMDREDAVIAAEFIGAGTVIPIHFNTFPAIETDAEAWKADVESKTKSKAAVLKPGESLSV